LSTTWRGEPPTTKVQQQQQQQQHQQQEKNNNNKKKVIGQPVESFSYVVGVDRKVKQACSIGGQLPVSLQRLFLELPRDEDKGLVADFIIDSYHEKDIAVKTKCTYISNLVIIISKLYLIVACYYYNSRLCSNCRPL
jgi:hypothetical protein